MNDLRILDDLFEKHNDEIHFQLFKRSNNYRLITKTKEIIIKK